LTSQCATAAILGSLDVTERDDVPNCANPPHAPRDQPLPPHAPACFGCGSENPCGLGLHAWRVDDEIHGEVTFATHHSGAPTFAHGGAVATAIDDCLGFLLYLIEEPGVTARLEIDYRKPVLLQTLYALRARVDRRDGRKIYASLEMRDPAGVLAAEGTALFVTVSIEHFTRDLPADWKERAKELGELPW
jgi:acyl-coenzyme A thioesterase PaaI-like protein